MTLRLRGCEDVLELRMSDGKPRNTWIPIGLWKLEPCAKGFRGGQSRSPTHDQMFLLQKQTRTKFVVRCAVFALSCVRYFAIRREVFALSERVCFSR